MVSSLSYLLPKGRVTGFGIRRRVTHRRPTRGCGVVRRTIGNISRPALVWAANKIADVITGSGRLHRRHTIHHRRRTVRSAGSYKYAGLGLVRRPRRHLTVHRRRTTTVGGYRRHTVHRRPRSTLLGRRRVHRRHVMLI